VHTGKLVVAGVFGLLSLVLFLLNILGIALPLFEELFVLCFDLSLTVLGVTATAGAGEMSVSVKRSERGQIAI
jgi:hypothetical protein